jgi:metal-responsive CopG/Arc/MetJ family transcriptional regulator
VCYISLVMVMPKKPAAQKRKPTGVSLEANLLKQAKAHAKKKGYGSLSALITTLLRDAVEEAKQSAKQAGESQISKAKGKLRRR